MLEDLLACFRLRVQQQVILEAKQVGVAQDAALGIEEKCVTTLARPQVLDLIRSHGVEQAGAVLATDAQSSAAG